MLCRVGFEDNIFSSNLEELTTLGLLRLDYIENIEFRLHCRPS